MFTPLRGHQVHRTSTGTQPQGNYKLNVGHVGNLKRPALSNNVIREPAGDLARNYERYYCRIEKSPVWFNKHLYTPPYMSIYYISIHPYMHLYINDGM